ncbi:hypothetical protein DRE_06949 [Drechslerella stenobrocha 248]|uniref:Uncharacterized protein n=1 Tax=Drechslerella stenobrocha 248 TaxID=1043628 RepID=W7HM82_9PEZI|nr:hypothetical protein DRE_06949 [Drechslerella stenobrocha 248]
MASKLQLPPLNFESRGSLTADFHIPDSPPHSRPATPSRYDANETSAGAGASTANNSAAHASAQSSRKTDRAASNGHHVTVAELTSKPSTSTLHVSPNSPPMSPHSPRPGSVRHLLSKMSLSGSYKEADEATLASVKSSVHPSQSLHDGDSASERALSVNNKGFFSSFRRNSSKRSVSSTRSKTTAPPTPIPTPREPTIEEKTADLIKKEPAPQIPDLPQASFSSFENDLFKHI